jgi:hypothetical protein
MSNPKFADLFKPGRGLSINIALENFKASPGETKDFRVNYAFSFNFYDQTPESVASSVLGFTVTPGFNLRNLGTDRSMGQVFSYKLNLRNNKPHTGPVPMQ